jgi:TRAP-type C4-dicarboxylate transport system permease small subunit
MINVLSRWLSYVGIVVVMILMVVIVIDVFLRFVFNSPMPGVAELVALMMACLALGLAWGHIKGRHIAIDLLVGRFPPRTRAVTDIITLVINLGVMAFIAWRAFVESLWALESKSVASDLMPVPEYPFWWAYVLGMFVFCLAMLIILIQKIRERTRA